jgi:hypothetical protein
MKYLVAAILSFSCGFMWAAIKDSDGNLLLSPDEVAQTIALWNQVNQLIDDKNDEIKKLQKELEFYKSSKCL